MNKKIHKASILIAIIVLIRFDSAQPQPLHQDNNDAKADDEYNGNLDKTTIEQLRKCDMDMKTLELCMRCAKVTKSTIVYPLCCANEDKIKDWCHDYVFFRALYENADTPTH